MIKSLNIFKSPFNEFKIILFGLINECSPVLIMF